MKGATWLSMEIARIVKRGGQSKRALDQTMRNSPAICVIARAEVGLIRKITLDRNDCERSTHRKLKCVPNFKESSIGLTMKDASASMQDANARPTVPQTTRLNVEAYNHDGRKGEK